MAVDITYIKNVSSEKLEMFARKDDLRSWVLVYNALVATIRKEEDDDAAMQDEDDWLNTCIEELGDEEESEIQRDEGSVSDEDDETESEEDYGPSTPEEESLRPPFYGHMKPTFFIHEDDDDDDSEGSDDECITEYDKTAANNMSRISDPYHWSMHI